MNKMNKTDKTDKRDKKIGIIAGAGRYPLFVLRKAKEKNRPVVVVAFRRITVEAVVREADDHHWFAVGQIKKSAAFLSKSGVEQAIFAGGIPWRPLLVRPKPDFVSLTILKGGFKGENHLLTQVADAYKNLGIEIIDPKEFIGDLLVENGALVGPKLSERMVSRAHQAFEAAIELGHKDKGQAAIASEKGLLFEDLHGTDGLLKKAAKLGITRGILAKTAKPGQDHRFDLPALGPTTIAQAARAGIRGIAVQAGATLLLDREESKRIAERLGITLIALEPPSEASTGNNKGDTLVDRKR